MSVFRNPLAWGSLSDTRPAITLLCEWKRCGSQLHIKEFYLVTIIDAGLFWVGLIWIHRLISLLTVIFITHFISTVWIICSFWYGLRQEPGFRSSVISFNDRTFDQLSFFDCHNEQWENTHTAIVAVLHSEGSDLGGVTGPRCVVAEWASIELVSSQENTAVPFLLRKLALISGRRGQSEGLHRLFSIKEHWLVFERT